VRLLGISCKNWPENDIGAEIAKLHIDFPASIQWNDAYCRFPVNGGDAI
jgi:hypothetical protein